MCCADGDAGTAGAPAAGEGGVGGELQEEARHLAAAEGAGTQGAGAQGARQGDRAGHRPPRGGFLHLQGGEREGHGNENEVSVLLTLRRF